MAKPVTPLEQTSLFRKVGSFNSHLAGYFKYQSKLIEDEDSDESLSEVEDNGEEGSKASSEKETIFNKSVQPIPGAVLGHLKRQQCKFDFEKEQQELEDFSKTFSLKCEQKLRLDTGIGRGRGHVSMDDKGLKLAELFRYEGFRETGVNALPGVDMKEILLTTLLAQPNLAFKKAYEDEAQLFFLSPLSVDIATDVFWWFFLEKYAHNEETQDRLLQRVSENYVKFLWQPASSFKNIRFRNAFFKNYPDILSQAMYCAFCHTFPASWRQYNDSFINNVTANVFLWFTGCKCEFDHHKKWCVSDLEPLDLKADFETGPGTKPKKFGSTLKFADEPRESLTTPGGLRDRGRRHHAVVFDPNTTNFGHSSSRQSKHRSQLMSPLQIKKFASRTRTSESMSAGWRNNQFKSKDRKGSYAFRPSSYGKRDLSQSTPMNMKDSCDHFIFNVAGISPLLTSYLRRNLHNTGVGSALAHNRVLIGRTELHPASKPISFQEGDAEEDDSGITYAEFVAKQFKRTKSVLKEVSEKEKTFNRQIAEMWKLTNAELRESEEKLQVLLTHNAQVKKLSNLLMLEIMTEPSQRTALASKAIKDALDAIDVHKTPSLSTFDSRATDSSSSMKIGLSLSLVANKNSPIFKAANSLPPISQK